MPEGHWHMTYLRNGEQESAQWVPNVLEEPHNLYLKGNSEGKGQGKGIGKGPGGKGKGKGKNKGKGKGNGKGKRR